MRGASFIWSVSNTVYLIREENLVASRAPRVKFEVHRRVSVSCGKGGIGGSSPRQSVRWISIRGSNRNESNRALFAIRDEKRWCYTCVRILLSSIARRALLSDLIIFTSPHRELRSMQKYRFAIATGENHLIRVDKRIKFIVYTSLCRKPSPSISVDCIGTRLSISSGAVATNAAGKSNRRVRELSSFRIKNSARIDISERKGGKDNNIHFFRSIFFTKAADFSLYNPICPRIPHIRSLLHDKRDSSRAISQVRMKILIRSLRFFARVKTRRYRDGMIRGISTPLAN